MTASCSSSARAAGRDRTSALPSSSRITPTATNDSQNPAASGANGSSSSTATSASDQVRAAFSGRAHSRAQANTASISQVRCVGTENPASSE